MSIDKQFSAMMNKLVADQMEEQGQVDVEALLGELEMKDPIQFSDEVCKLGKNVLMSKFNNLAANVFQASSKQQDLFPIRTKQEGRDVIMDPLQIPEEEVLKHFATQRKRGQSLIAEADKRLAAYKEAKDKLSGQEELPDIELKEAAE